MRKFLFILVGSGLLLNACNNDDDNGLNPTSNEVTVQNFMWKAMNEWYFWQEDVTDLADDRFANNQEYTEYLQAGGDPESFIESLRFSEDRFTFYNEDFEVLLNSLSGIRKSNGLQTFSVDLLSDDSDVNRFLFVRNVIPGSDAANQGIKRGDVFYGVDGVQFTSQNISELLSPDTYTLNKGELDVVNRLVNTTNEEITITKEENLLEPPIRLATTLDINGTKIGYLMYQRFNRDFKDELNDIFGQFKADNVTDLVLDLRYNPGGDVATSGLLASMIYSDNTNELYIKQRWNSKQQERFEGNLEDYFSNVVNGNPLNTLNLNRVFILATGSSASASELLMNGLDPYIEVIHIGTTTRGKNEFSISLVDDPDNRYSYSSSRVDNINPDNKWIIQPLVGRNENSVGFIDYTAGFSPDFELREDVFNLGTFGDPNEPLLAKAIERITNVSSKIQNKGQFSSSPNEVIEIDFQEKGIMILDKSLQ